MKLFATVLIAGLLSFTNSVTASRGISVSTIKADSELGLNLLSKARRVEEGEENNEENQQNNWNVDVTWVAGYSIKFQGCHHIMQWNNEEDGEEDVRIKAKRLVRFRLCPTSSCSENKAAGCKSGYGDYIIDMNTFLQAYIEAKKNAMESECESALQTCGCNAERKLEEGGEEDGGDDDCAYNCFSNLEMLECMDAEDGGFNPEEYMDCAGVGGRRKLDQEGEGEGENEQQQDEGGQEYDYYVGPYCSSQGGEIYLGMFSDDTCTEFAGVTYYSVTGNELPYEKQSIVGPECLSCAEMADGNDDGNSDADNTSEQCEMIYNYAGKCEQNLPKGTVEQATNSACGYMEGIKITREDGIIFGKKRRSPVATTFIVLFALLFATMAFYVYYLRKRLGVRKDSLL